VTAVTPTLAPDPFSDLRDAWRRATPRTKTRARVCAVLGMVLVAYHYSLLSLLQTLNLETPLAYVGLVPPMALVIAFLRARTAGPETAIYDRQLDYIVGVPLMALALAINFVFPHRLSTMFWLWRIDLFSLPFFVAGAVCTVFGIRTMWRQRLAIGFLFLAWPVPYNVFLLQYLNRFTGVTLSALHSLLHVVRVAAPVPGSDGSLFQIAHHGQSFQISVVSACSGVNGMVGFLLVGVAFGAIVRGPGLRKAVWLFGGMLLLWAANLSRLLFICWAGHTWGEQTAIDVFHPFVGLLTFNLGIIAMLLLLKPFRLTVDGTIWSDSRRSAGVSEQQRARSSQVLAAAPRVRAALAVVAILGLALGILNSGLQSYDIVATALGAPRLASFSEYPATPKGWRAQKSDEFDWAKPYFGASSTWLRYTMFSGISNDVSLRADQAVIADVISTSDLTSFSAYGVEACYRFHGFKLRDVASVDLGAGVSARALSYYNTKQQQDWTVVYWIWPVRTETSTRYERVTLYVQNSNTSNFDAASVSGIHGTNLKSTSNNAVDRKLLSARAFLVAFGREVIRNQSLVRVGTHLPVQNNLAFRNGRQLTRPFFRVRSLPQGSGPATAPTSTP